LSVPLEVITMPFSLAEGMMAEV